MEQEPDRIFSFSITSEQIDIRVDAFLASQIDYLTRSRVQELIRKEQITVNGRLPKSGYRLKMGDEVRIVIPPAVPYELKGEHIEFGIIHEDASLIVLNKPPGLVIHPAPGHSNGTLVHGLLQHCDDLSGIGGVLRPGIVHRLDKDTSGLMVVAKNDRAYQFLAGQFKGRTIRKGYLATVCGIPVEVEGNIDLPIARHPKRRKEMSVQPSSGRRALTLWRKLEEFKAGFSLLSVTLKTGRTHQIRVHLSYLGYPIIGDPVYGHKKKWWKKRLPLMDSILPNVKRQQLHAEKLGFVHPDSGDYCEFNAPLPDDMKSVLKALRELECENEEDKKD